MGRLAAERRFHDRQAGDRAAVLADPARLLFADADWLDHETWVRAAVWGTAVLHHLDLAVAAVELRRVLRAGGVAVFCEPWAENPLLRLARRRLPYPGKQRTADEEPLRCRDLAPLRRVFPALTVEG